MPEAPLPWTPITYERALIPGPEAAREGMWRWRRLLPFDGSAIFPVTVGGTPLVPGPRLAAALGLGVADLFLKDETRSPTGSNKDRATALCVADAMRSGLSAIAAASSGNVAVSLAAGAAAAGLSAYVFVPAAASPHKVALMRSFGATVFLVDGSYEVGYRLSEAACREFGWYNRNTGHNPLAVQAKKTVAFEVWDQLGRRMPHRVYIPVGDGVTLAAFVHGCHELIRCGVAERLPEVIGVQATGAAPLARAFSRGAMEWRPVEAVSVADGIAVGDPAYGREALAAISETSGRFVTVSDGAIQRAIRVLGTQTGLLAEPAGATAIAGMAKDARVRPANRGETWVAMVTGSGLKDHRWLPLDAGRAISIEPSLAAIASALRRRE